MNNLDISEDLRFKWLGVGVITGNLGAASLTLASTVLSLSYLFYQNSPSILISTLGVIFSLQIFSSFESQRDSIPKFSIIEKNDALIRVQPILKDLCDKGNFPLPIIIISDKTKNFAIGNNRFSPCLYINLNALSVLDNDELKGIISHELNHLDRKSNVILKVNEQINIASMILVLQTVTDYIYTTCNFLPDIFSFTIGLGGAVSTLFILERGRNLLKNVASRANEIRTDLRAIELTKDPDAFISGLSKLYSINATSNDTLSQALSTHPNLSMRKKWILKFFSNQDS